MRDWAMRCGSADLVTFYIVLVDNGRTVLPDAHVYRAKGEAEQFCKYHADARMVSRKWWV